MFGKLKEAQVMFSKYKDLQKQIKNLVIRSSYGEFVDETTKEDRTDAIVVEIEGQGTVKSVKINNKELLGNEKELTDNLVKALNKGNEKLSEIIKQKTTETLGVDPENLSGLLS